MKEESKLARAIREIKERDQNCFGGESFKKEIENIDQRLGDKSVDAAKAGEGEYSYTETCDDLSIKLCFKTNAELIEFLNCQKKQ
ncbi:hypothetical protein MAELSTROM_7 [Pseudoalteromonas phage Maelstrom]|uniref:hypothetical protein n=1 Tax=Pseudoalteromonas phage Maelstrom TaxID=2065202 RepID=UPI000CA1F745|nr:hypothetical protein PP584_gp07 [Pseudoalteromonas phage Maelstrom]AUG84927.1 hypothetical protein MAELSTROM_7 [Pseudoalteromonas phage Maelstrom]